MRVTNLLCLLMVLLMGSLLAGCGKSGTALESASTPPAATEAQRAPDPVLQKLQGKWLRADGDYLLEIVEAQQPGTITAHYFNPSPINVSKALSLKEGTTTKLFVELQDTGYPGCTYSLTYDPAADQLHGQYYQAAQQETYDVVFARYQQQ